MRYSVKLVVLSAPALLAQGAESQVPVPDESLLERVEIRTLEEDLPSLSWQEAIDTNVIEQGQHVIVAGDTYVSIIEQYGLRADPNSILMYKELNRDRFSARGLPLGALLSIVVGQQDSLAVVLDTDLKRSISATEMELLEQRTLLRERVEDSTTAQEFTKGSELHAAIISEVQLIKETGYALDRGVLESTRETLDVVKDIASRMLDDGRPTESDLTFLESSREALHSARVVSRNTDRDKTVAYIVTVRVNSGEVVDNLTVCFEPALKLLLHRHKHGSRTPEWKCDRSFHSLSSPAKSLFDSGLKYVVWATRGAATVFEFREVTIEANRRDGSFRYELHVTDR